MALLANPAAALTTLSYQLLDSIPHPRLPFSQGLILDDGLLVESSGLYGQSFIQRYHPQEPKVAPQTQHLPRRDFAEGLTRLGDHYWLLTWQQGLARQLDRASLKTQRVFRYPGEGWGLTQDGQWLIRSDGSDRLHWHSPVDFKLEKSLPVRFGDRPLKGLNELEYASGLIWANVWFDSHIYAINPATGEVVASLDLTPLVLQETGLHPLGLPREAVLNGIAYDAQTDSFWITGKRWRRLYRIRISWPDSPAATN